MTLKEFAEDYGYDDVMSFLSEVATDSVVPGFCRKCGAEADLEPDGMCECECGGTIKSVLLMAGII